MIVKVIKKYLDTTRNRELMEVGTELTVPAERGKTLIEAGVAEEIKEIKNKSKK